jgi:hypothetical protein
MALMLQECEYSCISFPFKPFFSELCPPKFLNFVGWKGFTDSLPLKSSLADGGDGIEDANLEEAVANATILRLYELRKWCKETVKDTELRTGKLGLFDNLFSNELNILVSTCKQFYEDTSFKLALKSGFYDFVSGPPDS